MNDFSRKISYKKIDKKLVEELEYVYLTSSRGISLFNLFTDYGLQLVQEIASKNPHTSPHFIKALSVVIDKRIGDE